MIMNWPSFRTSYRRSSRATADKDAFTTALTPLSLPQTAVSDIVRWTPVAARVSAVAYGEQLARDALWSNR